MSAMDTQTPHQTTALCPGETPISHAPILELDGGTRCIPQHYLHYAHTRDSVEALVARIDFDPHFPIFVSEDAGGLFVQIGIIGHDNYGAKPEGARPKIVFGRRWRVERNLPTSEIIQTCFLALKKAREHEIRELFTLRLHHAKTTPFNNHHDLPLIARHGMTTGSPHTAPDSSDTVLDDVRYDGRRFHVVSRTALPTGHIVISLSYAGEADFIGHEPLVFLIEDDSPRALLHGLIAALIARSDQHIDEHFLFDGFARFSKTLCPYGLSALSVAVRQTPVRVISAQDKAAAFSKTFAKERYETDATRIPTLPDSPYNAQLRAHLAQFNLSNYALVCGPKQS